MLTAQRLSPALVHLLGAAFPRYLHVSLFQQRLVAVGRRVWDDDAIVLTLGPEAFIQQHTGRDRRGDKVSKRGREWFSAAQPRTL